MANSSRVIDWDKMMPRLGTYRGESGAELAIYMDVQMYEHYF
jgi:hypothetical protein